MAVIRRFASLPICRLAVLFSSHSRGERSEARGIR